MRSERGLTGRAELDVIGEFHGQVFFGHGHGAAFFAMNHGNGGAPISLAGHRPVAEPVIDFLAAFSEFVQPHGNGVARFVSRKTVKFPAVDKNAVFAERKDGFAAFLLDDLRDGQMIFFGKSVIAFVVRGHRHHRARAVGIQHIICKIDGHFFAGDRMNRIRAREHARFFAGGGKPVDVVGFGGIGDIGVDVSRALGMSGFEFFHQRVLGGKHDIFDAEKGIGAGGEHRDDVARLAVEPDFTARGLADPVFLHQFCLFRPVEGVQTAEQFFRILGDAEKPLRHIFAQDGGAAALAFSVRHLFVGEHGFAGRAPVDQRFLAIGESFFIKLEKEPLRPFVVIFFAGFHFRRPVEHGAHAAELTFHRFDVLFGGVLGMNPGFDRIIFRREPEGVEAHRLKDLIALHFFEPGIGIGRTVIIPVPDVQFCAGGIGKHFENIPFFIDVLFVESILPGFFPFCLPFALHRLHVHHPDDLHNPQSVSAAKNRLFLSVYYRPF